MSTPGFAAVSTVLAVTPTMSFTLMSSGAAFRATSGVVTGTQVSSFRPISRYPVTSATTPVTSPAASIVAQLSALPSRSFTITVAPTTEPV